MFHRVDGDEATEMTDAGGHHSVSDERLESCSGARSLGEEDLATAAAGGDECCTDTMMPTADVILDFPSSASSLRRRGRCRLLAPGSLATSSFNLASATLGAGTLALPFTLYNAGALPAIAMLAVSCFVTVMSIRFLTRAAQITQQRSYETLAFAVLGPSGRFAASASIILFCLGCAVLYVVMLGDVLDMLSRSVGWLPALGWRLTTTIYWLLCMTPLCLLRHIDMLRYASLAGCLSTVLLLWAMAVEARSIGAAPAANINLIHWDSTAWAAFPTLTFCFCCQMNTFEILDRLQQPSVARMTAVASLTCLSCTAIYVAAGLLGVASFGSGVAPNVLLNYSGVGSKPHLFIAVVGVAVTLTMAFPCAVLPLRDSVLQAAGVPVWGPPAATRNAVAARVGVSLLASVTALVLGVLSRSVTLLLAVTGGVTGAIVALILPAAIAWKAGAASGRCDTIIMGMMAAIGVVMGVASSVLSARELLAP